MELEDVIKEIKKHDELKLINVKLLERSGEIYFRYPAFIFEDDNMLELVIPIDVNTEEVPPAYKKVYGRDLLIAVEQLEKPVDLYGLEVSVHVMVNDTKYANECYWAEAFYYDEEKQEYIVEANQRSAFEED